MHYIKILGLILSTAILSINGYTVTEDRDLSGCSVELDSNIFNLMGLSRNKK